MLKKSRFAASLLLVPMLLVTLASAPTVSAGPLGHGDDPGQHKRKDKEFVHETVNWSMTPEQCTLLHSTLSGTGERDMRIVTRTNQDGTVYRVTKDVVKGTASDNDGTYRFVYRNQLEETIPPGGAPIQVHMVDSFDLKGRGSPDINVAFDWTWSYSPPAELWPPGSDVQKLYTRGDVNCDPI